MFLVFANMLLRDKHAYLSSISNTYSCANMSNQVEERIQSLAQRLNRAEKDIESLRARVKSEAPAAVDRTCISAAVKDTQRVAEVRQWSHEHGMHSAVLQWIPPHTEPLPLAELQQMVKADSLQHFCKSLLIENTHCTRGDCSDPRNSRYYIVHLQYVEKFDAALLAKVVREWNEGLGKKKFSFTFASPELFKELTGYEIGAMAPFCTRVKIPVLLSSSVLSLSPPYMWFGAGDVFCKYRADVQNFIDVVQPIVATFTVPIEDSKIDSLIV